MNKYLLIFALIFAVVSHSNLSKAQTCTACFTATADSINSLVINLDASCSNAPNALYEWHVDGTLYTVLPFPSIQLPFNVAGTHSIKLIMYDQGCIDSTTQSITVIQACNANFYPYQFGNGNYYFIGNNNSPTATYSWTYGDGNIGNTTMGYNNYATSGSYTVCCIVSDTAQGGCVDTFCQVITVNMVSTCQASFTYSLDPLTGYIFADGSSSQYDPSNYSMNWYLNNIPVQSGSNVSYVNILGAVGIYDLKLEITDSNQLVCSDFTQSLYWNGGVLNPICYPCITLSMNATNDSVYLDASCSVIPAGGSLKWYANGNMFADNGMPFMQGFSSFGLQTVALYSIDSNGNYCDSTFQYVYTYAPPCLSCLTVTQVPSSSSDYVFDGSCTPGATTFYWFVDNNYVTTTNTPQFIYSFSQSGTYSVCLQTVDALGISCSQACTSVLVNTPTATQFNLSGTVYKVDNTYTYAPATANEAKVYLIKLMTGGFLDAIDSTTTDANGMYTFLNKPIDDYRIKVALKPSSPNYAINIPTYYNSALMWYNAQVITLFGNTYSKDVYMSYGANTAGSGFISGNVFLGSNKPTRSGNADVTIILIDQSNQQAIAYAKTDANGNYSFSNVPYGTYRVYGELLNRASIPDNIIVSNAQSSFTNKNFVYNDNVIKPTNIGLSVSEQAQTIAWSIYPNPANNQLTIRSSVEAAIRIVDITGRQIQQVRVEKDKALTLDCSQWQSGIYLVEQYSQGKKKTMKLVINHE